jgi:hypothetical protein
MATARLQIRKLWLEGVSSEDSELRRVVEGLVKKGKGDGVDPYLIVECDALHPFLFVVPDEAVERTTYRGARDCFRMSPCVVQGEFGVSVQVTDPSAEDGRQTVSVYGAPHSQVRGDFSAIWSGLRSPVDVGQPFVGAYDLVGQRTLPLKRALELPEREIVLRALRSNNWNRQRTAVALDINRTTLFNKMRKYGLLDRLVGAK